ncbi:MAG TPA: DUF362 domain-containing protein [Myxococcota bacterium]|nr:DUF362 domain-containing protein [Myxococcota bacterium]
MTGADSALVAIRRMEPPRAYPPAEERFSPDTRYPEYPFKHVSRAPNPVYRAVRELLRDLGLDRENFDTPRWNPLRAWVAAGQSVFCLVNFVTHRRLGQSAEDNLAMVTHPAVLRPVLDYLVLATGDAARVAFGNAPVQSADVARLGQPLGLEALSRFYREETGHDPGHVDLRLYACEVSPLGYLRRAVEQDDSAAVMFDTGAQSWLEGLPRESIDRFRVEDYAAEATQRYHGPGRHLYVVHRRVLEADLILHVAKLKTHAKVGLTGGLKGAVGAIGRKDCLAHYRAGGARQGGDEFRDDGPVVGAFGALGERLHMDGSTYDNVLRIAHKNLARFLDLVAGSVIRGSWPGNDTTWRMALDINRCLTYGTLDGRLADQPQRRIACMLDGVIAGEGEGPLHPKARNDGLLLGAAEACLADLGAALVMGFDPARLPIVRNAFAAAPYPLTARSMTDARFVVDGRPVPAADLPGRATRPFEPPRAWRGHVELAARSGAPLEVAGGVVG